MTIELMGNRRHAELIKAAEETVEGINDGAHPNAALTKVAKDHDLNSKEIALVSSTVNNALTVSHLADSEPEQKADPFVITNADEVSQQLFPEEDGEKPQNGIEPGKKPTDEDAESPNSLDPQDQAKKKTASERILSNPSAPRNIVEDAYLDYGSYHDAGDDGLEFVKTAREAFGYDPRAMAGGRMKVAADLDGVRVENDWGQGDRTSEHAKYAMEHRDEVAVSCGRMVNNPFAQLRNLKVACDEARTRYDAARTAAYCQLEKIAEDFRRTDAPQFARVAALAKRAGVDPATLDIIFTSGGLDRFGHTNAQVKLASHGIVTCSHYEHDLVQKVSQLETFWKQAAHCLAAKEEVEARTADAETAIHKVANLDAGAYARDIGQTASEFPALAMGGGDPTDPIGEATGTSSDEDVKFEGGKSPLDATARQRLKNTGASATFTSLLDDDFIAARPIPDIVRAYNAVMQATKHSLPAEQIRAAVKRQLAGGEDLDLETMMNLNKSHSNE